MICLSIIFSFYYCSIFFLSCCFFFLFFLLRFLFEIARMSPRIRPINWFSILSLRVSSCCCSFSTFISKFSKKSSTNHGNGYFEQGKPSNHVLLERLRGIFYFFRNLKKRKNYMRSYMMTELFINLILHFPIKMLEFISQILYQFHEGPCRLLLWIPQPFVNLHLVIVFWDQICDYTLCKISKFRIIESNKWLITLSIILILLILLVVTWIVVILFIVFGNSLNPADFTNLVFLKFLFSVGCFFVFFFVFLCFGGFFWGLNGFLLTSMSLLLNDGLLIGFLLLIRLNIDLIWWTRKSFCFELIKRVVCIQIRIFGLLVFLFLH